jgi:hypothetical protein
MDRFDDRQALALEDIRLPQLRDDLLGLLVSIGHLGPPPDFLKSGWTKSLGEHHHQGTGSPRQSKKPPLCLASS